MDIENISASQVSEFNKELAAQVEDFAAAASFALAAEDRAELDRVSAPFRQG
ncbi:MAG: hypothetical protein GX465_12605 [Acidobacteria bacterium]|nr:hypothetical protein [Acidobacteriota bacterium]